jgi:hypothetical protein
MIEEGANKRAPVVAPKYSLTNAAATRLVAAGLSA